MIQTSLPFNVNYIVYEKGDTAFLLEGYIKLKNKKYFTTIPIEILRLSRLIEKSEGTEIMQFIWNRFYSSNDPVVEFSPNKHLKRTINLNTCDLGLTNHQLKIA